ncbi:MAG: UDP-N-acetylmuramoyl-tripeptide--D-alanyl-D-alanine ligase [Gammaproteobacteria bacterium]
MIRMTLSRAADAMNARYHGQDVEFIGCSTDSRTLQKQNLFIAIKGENFDGHDFVSKAEAAGASSLLLQKNVEHVLPALTVDDTRKAMGKLARAWREQLAIPLVAITGSNGKTTVKEMVKAILANIADVHATSGNLNNDIGVPLTLFALDQHHRYAVIEMGANHPGEIAWLSSIARPNVAVITQCAPAHLEGFGSIDGVASAKAEIYSGLGTSGTAIINADDDYAEYWKAGSSVHKQCTFAIENTHADVRALDITTVGDSTEFTLLTRHGEIAIRLPLPGRHNVMNALAAAACCISLGIELMVIRKGLEQMQGVKGRLQIGKGYKGCRVIDDTYNANPTSLAAAVNVLMSYPGKHVLVLGDMGELGESSIELHATAGKQARVAGVDQLFTLGELSRHASAAFGDDEQHYVKVDKLTAALLDAIDETTTLLIKGSRSMKMERVVEKLLEGK